MCRSVTVSSLCATQHSPSAWADFVPKLTSTLTVTENKKILSQLMLHFFAILLTNPLEHGDAIVQHDSGVQILSDVFDACSAEPQSPPNRRMVREINCPYSWNLTIEVDE